MSVNHRILRVAEAAETSFFQKPGIDFFYLFRTHVQVTGASQQPSQHDLSPNVPYGHGGGHIRTPRAETLGINLVRSL